MASETFRSSMNSLGWSRRDPDLPVNTSSQNSFMDRISSLNPFGDRGYVRLPTTEPGAPLPAPSRREEEDAYFTLSRWDRILIFVGCNLGAAACFVICFFLAPVLTLRPRKFALLWSVGSALFLVSWTAIMGFRAYVLHLLSGNRLPFTAAYFGSIGLTLYFAVGAPNAILTIIFAIIQLACLLWYLISYFPMGATGLRLASSFGARNAMAWMNN